MFRKELMKAGLIATISLLCLTGCSGQEKPTPNETTSVETETDEGEAGKESQETTTGEEVIGKFDPADVCKNISINGELVEFPWTLNKLGDEYEFDYVTNEQKDDGICGAYLMYKGERLFVVVIGDEDADRDSPIVYFLFDLNDGVTMYDFGYETIERDIIEKFGTPDKVSEDTLSINYWYNCGNDYIRFSFDMESKHLDSISFNLSGSYNSR